MYTFENKDVVIEAMRRNGIKSAIIEYSGSGDSGQVDHVQLVKRTGLEALSDAVEGKVLITEKSSKFKDGQWEEIVTKAERSLEEAIEQLCYELLSMEHGGWEINEGSQGEFKFDADTGEIRLEHRSFYIEHEDFSSVWEAE